MSILRFPVHATLGTNDLHLKIKKVEAVPGDYTIELSRHGVPENTVSGQELRLMPNIFSLAAGAAAKEGQ
jgi:hypothetical protein